MQGSIRDSSVRAAANGGGRGGRCGAGLAGMRDRGEGVDLQIGWGVKHGIGLEVTGFGDSGGAGRMVGKKTYRGLLDVLDRT